MSNPKPDMFELGGGPATLDKLDSLFLQRDYLRKHERAALQFWRPPNWLDLHPVAVCCDGDSELSGVFNYYRNLISSEPQGGFPAGRSSFWMVLDEPTGAFLGLFAYTSFAQSWPYLENALGWDGRKDLRLAHRKHIQFLARCLPSEPFGDLLGGKLLATIAASVNLLATQELRYSLPVAGLAICTLHGQGSQYNRLDHEGIKFLGTDQKGRGTYFCETRTDGLGYVRGDSAELGEWSVPTLARRINHWKERWYTKRLKHKGIPEFVSDQYALARFL